MNNYFTIGINGFYGGITCLNKHGKLVHVLGCLPSSQSMPSLVSLLTCTHSEHTPFNFNAVNIYVVWLATAVTSSLKVRVAQAAGLFVLVARIGNALEAIVASFPRQQGCIVARVGPGIAVMKIYHYPTAQIFCTYCLRHHIGSITPASHRVYPNP